MDTTGTTRTEREAAAPGPGRPERRLAWLLALVVVLVWAGALWPGGPSFDDLEGVAGNPLVNGERSPAAALVSDYWHHLGDAGHYRPLAIWSLALDQRLYGGWWPGYHLTALLLHGAVVACGGLLLVGLGRRAGADADRVRAWLLGLALAACHPSLAEPVAWISGRTSPAALLPGLLAALALLALPTVALRRLAAPIAGLGLLLCLLGKEDGYVAAVPLLGVLALRGGLRAGLVGAALALVAWLALRWNVYGAALPSAPFAPLAEADLGTRLADGGARMLRLPGVLLGDPDGSPALARPLDPGLPAALGGWLLFLFALALLRWRRASLVARVGLAGALLAWLPYQGWLPAGELFAPRFLYLPLLLAGPLLGEALVGLHRGLAARTKLLPAPGTLIGAAFLGLAMLAWPATRPFGSLEAFHEHAVAEAPGDPRGWNGLGLALEARGDREGARAAWDRAIEVSGDGYGRAHSNLGRLALEDGDRELALEHFERAAELGSTNPVAWANLGRLRLNLDDAPAAADAYLRATDLAPGMATAWRGLARAALAEGDLPGARTALARAEALAPRDPLTLAVGRLVDAAEAGP